jgi:rSAM/selenodomain-associated transferase 1
MDKKGKSVLFIFVKNPEHGLVKTRLAADIGDDAALNVYNRLLEYTESVATEIDVHKQIWYSKKIETDDIWPEHVYEKRVQSGKNLGERMSGAFSENDESGYIKQIIIGSDCAELTANHIEKAFIELDEHDVVLGPSEDGGYYLLGMRSYIHELFEGMSWSTENLYRETLQTIRTLQLSFAELEILNDIDTLDDLNKSTLKWK